MRRSRTGLAFALAGLLVVGAQPAVTGVASATPAASAGAVSAALPAGHSWKVTLLTGDVVRVRNQAHRPPQVSVEPGPGRRGIPFSKQISPDGTVRVIPLDVASKIGKVYDPTLFDVTALIREGDDDTRRADLPLIVQGGNGAAVSTLAASRRTLPSIAAVAVRQPKAQGPRLARSALAGNVRHVWLDRQVRTQELDHNLSRIGAPQAWNAGATGKGVKVAVLDTGVDATHPDLQGRIAEQENFSASPDTVDRNGHGTHVAATIAGTGAAADGERRGVAPDADLLIGKVLEDDGTGSESDVIAGMEWAAPQARIVSMSLGKTFYDPAADDPVVDALEDLTTRYNTLFVVAAGNAGPEAVGMTGVTEAGSIGTPGIARSALTVGAVDDEDRVAGFSSRGGGAMKPEISAPGVDVVAARAKGTSMGHPVDANYTSASGTSMATPHVAGAAADLLQRHPSWSWDRLKAGLVSTTDATSTGSVYEVGGGRLDVARAVTSTIVADQPSLPFGSVPFRSTTSVAKRLSWTNTGSSPVTLRLAAHVEDRTGQSHDAALGLPATVTVPAGGSAGVTVTLDPGQLTTSGLYSGVVTAQADGVSARTPVGAIAAPPTRTVTFQTTALPGTPPDALAVFAHATSLDDGRDLGADFGADGVGKLQVPEGHYYMSGIVGDTTPGKERAAFIAFSDVTVDGDTTVRLDASHAQSIRVSAPGMRLADGATRGIAVERGIPVPTFGAPLYFDGLFAGDSTTELLTTPIDRPRIGTLHAELAARLTDDSGSTVYDILRDLGASVPTPVSYRVDQRDFARIDLRIHALNGAGNVTEIRWGTDPQGFTVNFVEDDVAAASTRTDFVTGAPGISWQDDPLLGDLGDLTWEVSAPERQYPAGSRQTYDWGRQPLRPGPYSDTQPSGSFCTPGVSTRSRGNIHIELVDTQEEVDGFDCFNQHIPEWGAVTSRTMTLYAGDTAVGTSTHSAADFSVPAVAGTYRLRYDLDESRVLTVSTKTSTEWRFHSSPTEERLPLLLVDYRLPLDLMNHPAGDTATFTVSRVAGAATATVTGLRLWTSLDDGATWQPAIVSGTGGRYTAKLPHAATGQAVSLRAQATDSGGGQIDQTILRAYSGG